jgi:hypothetical protein
LNKGFTSENFNLSGNIPVDKILLNIKVSGDKMQGALIFNIFVEILSYLCQFLLFNEWIIFSTSCVEVFLSLMGKIVCLKFCFKYNKGSVFFVETVSASFLYMKFSATDEK